MAFGDCQDDQRLQSAWQGFCEQLQEAGEEAFKDLNSATPLQRADAFRYLAQNLGQAFDLALETKNSRYPAIHTFCTPYCKLGGDNADFVYQQAWIDGESVYRISGNRGTARFLNFAVQGERVAPNAETGWRPLHEPFGDLPEANLFGHQLDTGWDGSFELYIGGPQRGPNWLPTTPATRKLFIRQGFDRWDELPVRMRVERIDMTEPRPMPTPDELVEAMDWAGAFVTGLMQDKPNWTYTYAAEVDPSLINAFPAERRSVVNPVYTVDSDRKRGRSSAVMCWKLEPDEALIVEFDAHDGFWMMTNMGVFFTSMDYLYRPVSYTPSRATIDSDGKVRLVLAHDDPGYHNWIDTQGFRLGHLANRNLFTNHVTEFRTHLVRRADLADAMPADAARVTAQERTQQMLTRFHAILQRYCL